VDAKAGALRSLGGFGDDTSAVLEQDRQAIGARLYRCVLRKVLIDSLGKLRQLPLQIANEIGGSRGHPQSARWLLWSHSKFQTSINELS